MKKCSLNFQGVHFILGRLFEPALPLIDLMASIIICTEATGTKVRSCDSLHGRSSGVIGSRVWFDVS